MGLVRMGDRAWDEETGEVVAVAKAADDDDTGVDALPSTSV